MIFEKIFQTRLEMKYSSRSFVIDGTLKNILIVVTRRKFIIKNLRSKCFSKFLKNIKLEKLKMILICLEW